MDGNNLKRGKRRIEHWHIISALLMVYDFIAICLAYFLALWLRFHFVTSQPSKNGLVLA